MNTNIFSSKNSELDTQWSTLYRIATILSILMLLIIPLQVIIFVASPPPETVADFFQLYHSNWLLGLLSLDFLYIFNNVILIIIYLALFVRLFSEKPAICLIALALGLVGIACYFPTNPAFEMLTLSIKYYNALPEDKSHFIAAGETLLACYTGTAFNVYYVLGGITLILYSKVILKSLHFNKTIGMWGMMSGIFMIIPSSAGHLGMICSLISLIPWIVFLILLTRRFHIFSTPLYCK